MNKWGMKGIVLGLCLSMMAPMAVAMVPEMSVKAENGKTANDSRSAVKSLGDTDPVSTRPTMRSKS